MLNVFNFSCQIDALALAACLWFHNKSHILVLLFKTLSPVCFQFAQILRHQPCSRIEVKGLRKKQAQTIKIFTKRVLTSQSLHAWIVIRALVRSHSHNALWW